MKNPESQKFLAEALHYKELARKEAALASKAELELIDFSEKFKWASNTNIRNRVFDFSGVITQIGVEQAIDIISSWARVENSPITVRLTSPGGEVFSGLALYDFLASVAMKMPVYTVALGHSDSAAAVVLQAGTKRLIGPHSFITLHQISSRLVKEETVGLREQQADVRVAKTLNDELISIIADRVKLSSSKNKVTADEIRRKISSKTDWLIRAPEVVKLGLADEIGGAI